MSLWAARLTLDDGRRPAGPRGAQPARADTQGSLRELPVQHRGRPLQVLYTLDPPRTAILLLGGDKAGDDRRYERELPRAERVFDEHLETLRRERQGKKGDG